MRASKILRWVLLLSGGVTAINILILYFCPVLIPAANFSVVRLTFVGLLERRYGYILISALLAALILGGSVGVKKNRVLLPCLNLVLFLGDLIGAGILFAVNLLNGLVNTLPLSSGVVDMVVVVLSVLYFVQRTKLIRQNKNEAQNI